MTTDELVGRQLGEYRLEVLLGRGGMARVYRAVDVRLKRYAVVKVIDPPFRTDPEYTFRFEREAQAIAQLEHSHIVRLYRFDDQDGWLYMAMQYVEGADLDFVLQSYRADGEFIEPDEISRIVGEVCSALDYAHSRGVIHRDVKPANLMLDRQGHTYLADFGLALLTEVGTRGEIFGSPYYIAPEQAISSASAVPQSDLYAVGVILYEAFTGQVPFQAAESLEVARLHISAPPRPPRELRPALSADLEEVILKALAKRPEERYPTGQALAAAVTQALRPAAVTLLAPPRTRPRPTIPERVAGELASQPLPPLPAGLASPPPPPVEGQPRPPALPHRRSGFIYLAGLLVMLLGLGCLLGGGLLVWLRLAAGPRLTPEVGEPATPTAGVAARLPTAPDLLTATPTSPRVPDTSLLLPTETSSPWPTEPPQVYTLSLIKGEAEDSLIVVNPAGPAFPLATLRLGEGPKAFGGALWQIDLLEKGTCVAIWKDKAPQHLPEEVECQIVGMQVRKPKEQFWRETFPVYYLETRLGECEKREKKCEFSFSP